MKISKQKLIQALEKEKIVFDYADYEVVHAERLTERNQTISDVISIVNSMKGEE